MNKGDALGDRMKGYERAADMSLPLGERNLSVQERAHWQEARHFASSLTLLSDEAAKYTSGKGDSPIGGELLRAATRTPQQKLKR
jgi:hypothetical protein